MCPLEVPWAGGDSVQKGGAHGKVATGWETPGSDPSHGDGLALKVGTLRPGPASHHLAGVSLQAAEAWVPILETLAPA